MTQHDTKIAIIGLACRFPGNVKNHRDLLGALSSRDYIPGATAPPAHRFGRPYAARLGKIHFGARLEDAESFDAEFFGLSPAEARAMPPLAALFLEVAWRALEDSGLSGAELRRRTVGVFAASAGGPAAAVDGELPVLLADRLSYLFDLRGPSMSVDNHFAGSLTAVHLARMSLLNGETDVAFAGAASLPDPGEIAAYEELGVLSPTGDCRPFEAVADGTVIGEGCGVLVLKPLEAALRDGDHVYGVLPGSAARHDGHKRSFTEPSVRAQAKTIHAALSSGSLTPEDIDYIETHGTGTPVGDLREFRALRSVFFPPEPRTENRRAPLRLHATKSRLGHAGAAAGMAGLLHAVACVETGVLPAGGLRSEPARGVRARSGGYEFASAESNWPGAGSEQGRPRRAGVSAFGIGGSLAHVIVEEGPLPSSSSSPAVSEDGSAPVLSGPLIVSARDESAFRSMARDYLVRLASSRKDTGDVARLCHASAARPYLFERTAVVPGTTSDVLQASLRALFDAGGEERITGERTRSRGARFSVGRSPRPVFVFPGRGWQYVGMGRDLLRRDKHFRDTLEEYDAIFRSHIGISIIDLLLDAGAEALEDIVHVQCALFSIQAAMSETWLARGIRPDSVIGHSLGEMAAARTARVLTSREAALVVLERARHQTRIPPGAVTAVDSHAEEIAPLLDALPGLCVIAGRNSPHSTILSGEIQAIEEVERLLAGRNLKARRVKVGFAVHCALIDPLRSDFLSAMEAHALQPRESDVAFISSVTGSPVSGGELDANYWWRNLREPVEFAGAVEFALRDRPLLFLEIATRPYLSSLLLDFPGVREKHVPLLGPRDRDEARVFQEAMGALRLGGLDVDWRRAYGVNRRIEPPPYPLRPARIWESSTSSLSSTRATSGEDMALPGVASRETRLKQREGRAQSGPRMESDPISNALRYLRELLRDVTGRSPDSMPFDMAFKSLGLDSLGATRLTARLNQDLKKRFSRTIAWSFPTIRLMAAEIADRAPEFFSQTPEATPDETLATDKGVLTPQPVPRQSSPRITNEEHEAIAITAVGLRLPGEIRDLDGFARALRDGLNVVTEFPVERRLGDYYSQETGDQGRTYSRYGGFLQSVHNFDREFFSISEREAREMDPRHRLLLEVAYNTFEDQGSVPRGRQVGVYIGISGDEFPAPRPARPGDAVARSINAYTYTGTSFSAAAGRIAYAFDLKGPALAIDTACSSSLAAAHYACRDLRADACESALVGGVNLILSPTMHIGFSRLGAYSAAGRCATFDAGADGYVRSEGCVLVLLKKLSRARSDGDRIIALIQGSALNNDGASNGFTAPNPKAQEDVYRAALADANLTAADIGFIEAHGTGTPLGDPIEAESLARVYDTPGAGACALSSVKTNLGHLEAAAGIAGMLRAALSLRDRQITPHLNFHEWNPEVARHVAGSRFYIPTRLEPWESEKRPHSAAVSSFGITGTNAHLILSAPPAVHEVDVKSEAFDRPLNLLVLSATDGDALRRVAGTWRDFLMAPSASPATFREYARGSGLGREHHGERLALTAASREEALGHLDDFLTATGEPADDLSVDSSRERTELVFAFSGQGPIYWPLDENILRELPEFAEAARRCDEILKDMIGWSVLDELLRPTERLHRTEFAQPALCLVQIALVEQWRAWGVEPDAVIGHSMGELPAAYCCGALELSDVLLAVRERGRLIQKLAGRGGMAFAALAPEQLDEHLKTYNGALHLAAVNAPDRTVICGDEHALLALGEELARKQIFFRRLESVDFPSHGPAMKEVSGELRAALGNIRPLDTRVPFYSTTRGAYLSGPELDGAYWAENLERPVNFAGGIQRLAGDGRNLFLEIGPRPALLGSIARCLNSHGTADFARAFASMHKDVAPRRAMLRAMGEIHCAGREIDFSLLYPEAEPLPRMPGYPWKPEVIPELTREFMPEGAALPASMPASKKVDTGADGEADILTSSAPAKSVVPDLVLDSLKRELAAVAGGHPGRFDVDTPFRRFGVDSVMAQEFVSRLRGLFGIELPVTAIWNYPTLARLAVRIAELRPAHPGEETRAEFARKPEEENDTFRGAIAVIGIGCRLPGGVYDPDEFQRFLELNRDAVTNVPVDRWDAELYRDVDPAGRAAFLDNLELFDAGFFEVTGAEAIRMDPSQRLLLETTWRALENAALEPSALENRAVGVYVGAVGDDYSWLKIAGQGTVEAYDNGGSFLRSLLANRISYFYDWRGPSLTIDTACSSSLNAVHRAVQDLRNGSADLALAGGVNLLLAPLFTSALGQWGMLSPDGICNAFDAGANGYVRGEGCCMFALKRLDRARQDGDPIHAVLRGIAANQDGRTNGLFAPNGLSQQEVIRRALTDAGIDPLGVGLLEAHGTGTALGDPIEVEALAAVYGGKASDPRCMLSSVKANIGHLEAAAGGAGLLKLILAVKTGRIPGHPHFRELNPRIPLDATRLAVATASDDWPAGFASRIGAVSSFGAGGANVHAIVEQSPLADRTTRAPVAPRRFKRRRFWLSDSPFAAPAPDLYTVDYVSLLAADLESDIDSRPRLLVCGPNDPLAEKLAFALREFGEDPRILRLAGQGAGEEWQESFARELAGDGDGAPHVVLLSDGLFDGQNSWISEHEGDRDATSHATIIAGLMRVVLGFAAAMEASGQPCRLSVVVRGADHREGDFDPTALRSAAAVVLRGLARNLSHEYDLLRVDTLNIAKAEYVSEAARVLRSARGEVDVLVSPRGTESARLSSRETEDFLEASGDLQLDPRAGYLITGGAGALGARMVMRLAALGARTIFVTTRRELTPEVRDSAKFAETERFWAAAREAGASIEVVRADVTDRVSMRDVFDSARTAGTPIRGVVHAAGVYRTLDIKEPEESVLIANLAVKLQGTRVLHELTATMTLDFCAFFSSAAVWFGGRHAAHYAAANEYVNAIVELRAARGLPALAVGWGIWRGIGMGKLEVAGPSQRASTLHYSSEKAFRLLEGLLAKKTTGVLQAIRLDLDRLGPAYRARIGGRLFDEVLPAERTTSAASQESPNQPPANSLATSPDQPSALKARAPDTFPASYAGIETREEIVEIVLTQIEHVLNRPGDRRAALSTGFFQMGMNSLNAVQLARGISERLGRDFSAAKLFEYPNASALSDYLVRSAADQPPHAADQPPAARHQSPAPAAPARDRSHTTETSAQEPARRSESRPRSFARESNDDDDPVAIIGMACRFPGDAHTPDAFWENLIARRDCIDDFPADRIAQETGGAASERSAMRGGFLGNIQEFDADFFNITPREAEAMDPQQRLVLETSWEALEDAGLVAERLRGSVVGVYMGATTTDYYDLQKSHEETIDAYTGTGGFLNLIAGRLSYFLGLQGASMTLDTACSSSLVAVHLARRAILQGECDAAFAGGVNVILTSALYRYASASGMLSPEGRCRAFDARANGMVRAEGCGVLVLKRLSQARRDGDVVQALLMGSAVGQDGAGAGLTTPNATAQRRVLRAALKDAGLEPGRVGFIETHGTGTPLGDPVEFNALADVYGSRRETPLLLGAVKANIGHAESAAGVAGLIKAVHALRKGVVPPHQNLERLNEQIDLQRIPAAIPTRGLQWEASPFGPRIAGVSSFGISGTLAHILIREAEPDTSPLSFAPGSNEGYVLPVSAADAHALRRRAADLYAMIEADPALHLPDLAWTLGCRRSHLAHRAILFFTEREELLSGLDALANGGSHPDLIVGEISPEPPAPVFLFGGIGTQWQGMAHGLLSLRTSVFRDAIADCARELDPLTGRSLSGDLQSSDPELLRDIAVYQTLIFAVEVGLFRLWTALGIEPAACLGHSLGEIAAAVSAGILDLPDAARIVYTRATESAKLRGQGDLIAVEAGEEECLKAIAALPAELAGQAAVAAVNGSRSVVISGSQPALEAILRALPEGRLHKPLEVGYPAHSPALEHGARVLGALRLSGGAPAENPALLISSVTGLAVAGEMRSPAYWARNLSDTVRFRDALSALPSRADCFVEVSPSPVLLSRVAELNPPKETYASMQRGADDVRMFFGSLGRLFVSGARLNWEVLYPEGRLLPLPAYPWNRRRLWRSGRTRSNHHTTTEEAVAYPRLRRLAARADGELWYSTEIRAAATDWFKDHVVQERAILPGAAQLDLIIRAYQETLPRKSGDDSSRMIPVTLFDVRFLHPIPAQEGSRELQLRFSAGEDRTNGHPFALYLREFGADEWLLCARGRIAVADERPPPDMPTFSNESTSIPSRTLYERMAREGFHWGGDFRVDEDILIQDAGAARRVDQGFEAMSPLDDYLFYPPRLDACLQIVNAGILYADQNGLLGAHVFQGFDELTFYGPGTGVVWTGSRRRPDLTDLASGLRGGDWLVRDEAGRVLAAGRGLRGRYLLEETPESGSGQETFADWLHTLRWNELPRAELPRADHRPQTNEPTILLACDDQELRSPLFEALRDAGSTVATPEAVETSRRMGAAPASVLLVYVAAANRGEPTGERAADLCLRAAEWARFLEEWDGGSARFMVVTRGGAATGLETGGDPAHAALVGFCRSLEIELGAGWAGLIDRDPARTEGHSDAARFLSRAILACEAADQPETLVALRDERMLAARLVRSTPDKVFRPRSIAGDGSVLITGGLGGLGALSARRLLEEHDRRDLLLLGRSPLDETRAAILEELKAAGARVAYAKADLADLEMTRTAVQAVLREAGLPPIRGIIHAAGVPGRRTAARDTTRDELQDLFRPKVAAVETLTTLFASAQIDFAIFFSSAADVLHSPLIGTYAAANACMDGLVAELRHQGWNAAAINWSYWKGEGMARAVFGKERSSLSRGHATVNADGGLRLLDECIRRSTVPAGLAVIPADWSLWAREHGAQAAMPFYRELPGVRAALPEPSIGSGDSGASIDMLDFARELIASVTRRAASETRTDRSLSSLGVDSMMAIEIRRRLRAELKVDLPLLYLLSGYSIGDLAEKLKADTSAPRAEAPAVASGGAPVYFAEQRELVEALRRGTRRLEDLNDQELDEALKALESVTPL